MSDQTTNNKQMIAQEGLKFQIEEVPSNKPVIKAIGIGGCGCNIINTMIEAKIDAAEFIALNTDEQALYNSKANIKLQLGQRVTHGFGAGADVAVGREAALEQTEELTELLNGADLAFITVGMGGGTGTGATPVVASLAKQLNVLTVVAVVQPFPFEGNKRRKRADEGLEMLKEQVDTIFVIPNGLLMDRVETGSSFFDSFHVANNIVLDAFRGITEIMVKSGYMNCDFADIRSVMQSVGMAIVGSARQSGRDAAIQATRAAIMNSFVEQNSLERAMKVLVNVTGSSQLTVHDAREAFQLVQQAVHPDAEIIIGTIADETMGNEVKIMLIASDFEVENETIQEPANTESVEETPDRPDTGLNGNHRHEDGLDVIENPGEKKNLQLDDPMQDGYDFYETIPVQNVIQELELKRPNDPQEDEEISEESVSKKPGFLRRLARF